MFMKMSFIAIFAFHTIPLVSKRKCYEQVLCFIADVVEVEMDE